MWSSVRCLTVVAEWPQTFNPTIADWHLDPERNPHPAEAAAALDGGNLRRENSDKTNPHSSRSR